MTPAMNAAVPGTAVALVNASIWSTVADSTAYSASPTLNTT
jgi:hypothetical protein